MNDNDLLSKVRLEKLFLYLGLERAQESAAYLRRLKGKNNRERNAWLVVFEARHQRI